MNFGYSILLLLCLVAVVTVQCYFVVYFFLHLSGSIFICNLIKTFPPHSLSEE